MEKTLLPSTPQLTGMANEDGFEEPAQPPVMCACGAEIRANGPEAHNTCGRHKKYENGIVRGQELETNGEPNSVLKGTNTKGARAYG